MLNLWPLLLPLAAISGYAVAYKSSKTNKKNLSQQYVIGLNYLLDEQSDKAVDVFIKLLEVDSDTVETHLALGSLFRRRGEVNRAIRLHQNLIARPQLSILQRTEALKALGHDYMSAGVFDRAERIFLEVVELGHSNSLKFLLAIYEQEKSWYKALKITKKLHTLKLDNYYSQAAHYLCELAQEALVANSFENAYKFLNQALKKDKNSVRASLMLSKLEMQCQNYKNAIKILKKIPLQNPAFITEMINPLKDCYKELNAIKDFITFLRELFKDHKSVSLAFAIAEYIKDTQSLEDAVEFVSQHLSVYPSLIGVNELIYWHINSTHGRVKDKLKILYAITNKFVNNKPIYRCEQCGFSGKLIHWYCPSCKQWGKMMPVHGLEGE